MALSNRALEIDVVLHRLQCPASGRRGPVAIRGLRLTMAGVVAGLMASDPLRAQAPTAEVQVEEGRLSVDVEAVPLAEVLAAIAEQTGAKLVIRGDLGQVRPQSFRSEPLARGLRRLIGQNSMVLRFEPSQEPDAPGPLSRVMVYGADAIAPDEAAYGSTGGQSSAGSRSPPGRYDEVAGLGLRDRLGAVRELGRSNDDAVVPVLAEFLARDPDPQVRRAVVGNLARQGGPEASAVLQDALGDADRMVRIEAVRAFGSQHDENAVGPLVTVLSDDPDPLVRRVAVQVLGSFGTDEAKSALELAIEDADQAVRSAAASALDR